MKGFLTSFLFLALVSFAICVDHLIDAILGHSYAKIVIYGVLSLLLLISVLILLLSGG
jgi:hypothetical protein